MERVIEQQERMRMNLALQRSECYCGERTVLNNTVDVGNIRSHATKDENVSMEDVKDKTEVEVRMGIDSDEVEIVDEWMDVEVKESKGKGKEKDDGYEVMERENEKLKLKVKELEMKVSGLEEENEGVRERESRWRGFANNLRKKISRMSTKRGEDSDDDENESAMEYAFYPSRTLRLYLLPHHKPFPYHPSHHLIQVRVNSER